MLRDRITAVKEHSLVRYQLGMTFFIAALLGWVIETLYILLAFGRFSDRGLLYLPFCSIYGFGVVLLKIVLGTPQHGIVQKFWYGVKAGVLLGVGELFSGIAIQMIFGQDLWNYSGKWGNILGYVTFTGMFVWAILGTFYMCLLNARVNKLVCKIPYYILRPILYIIIVVYLIDCIFSTIRLTVSPHIFDKMVNP